MAAVDGRSAGGKIVIFGAQWRIIIRVANFMTGGIMADLTLYLGAP